ncbi:uncharacterized protein DNG_08327 [Cephalotrichum gorgonifer]|uniref:Zn(2)-C6 fungal-type domain-containing protein n=1 Tax=Cephalotrichum gorgonifer TaxID=2041049 RepID=A0AAE8SY89_9PEZI|nr:uncharacterized protein DNG_08327 [Cephalotrichum gorgonifer]
MDPTQAPDPEEQSKKPYHAKRPHRKSRRGCRACKSRKVKCDEVRPACRNCVLRREDCTYASSPEPACSSGGGTPSPQALEIVSSPRSSSSIRSRSPLPTPTLLTEPHFRPQDMSLFDMKLMWWYSTASYTTFYTDWGQSTRTRAILREDIPQRAFETPFLMDIVLCMSACHMQSHTPQQISPTSVAAYRARAFASYRRAIEERRPSTYAGMLAGSLLLIAIASQTFREAESAAGDLYIIDWMMVWRGIGTVVGLISYADARDTGMLPLFLRPAVDVNAGADYIPQDLQAMVSSLAAAGDDDEDAPYVECYQMTLRYIGGLYRELHRGPGPILHLQTVTWFTFLPSEFVAAVRLRRSRALVLLANYLPFIKLLEETWWLKGIADREIAGLLRHLGPDWDHVMGMPRAVMMAEGRKETARILLGDPDWEQQAIIEREKYLCEAAWIDTEDEPVDPPLPVKNPEETTWNRIVPKMEY